MYQSSTAPARCNWLCATCWAGKQWSPRDYYIAPQMLARGLTDFSFEAGKMRVGYGTSMDHYENTFASASYRRGLSDIFTAGIRVEADRDRQAAGLALTTLIAKMGVLYLATGWSDADGNAAATTSSQPSAPGRPVA